jgi:6-phosphogluconolactonase
VTSFAVDSNTAMLKPLSVQATRGAHPCHLVLDRTGRFLAVANYTGGNFAIVPVGTDGALAPATVVVGGQGRGPTDRQEGPHGHAVWFSPDNRFLVAADLGLDQLLVYRFDDTTGTLTPNDPPSIALAPGAGPRHTAFHPDGRRAFAINELNSTITSLAWDGGAGRFTVGESVSTIPPGVAGSTTAEIHLHPNGQFLYGSNRGHDSIAVFRVGESGAPTLVEYESTRGKTPRNFTIDPTGRWLIAANQGSSSLAVFSIDQETGALTAAGPLVEAPTPVSVVFLP